MAIGKNVQRLREKRGLTLAAVAEAVGTDAQAISQMEKRDSGTSKFAVNLAKFFGVDLADLMSEDFDPDQERQPDVTTATHRRLQWIEDDEAELLSQYRACALKEKETAMSVLSSLPKAISSEASRD